jgi:molecular chaperone HtpG
MKPILEINPEHPLIERLKADPGGARFDELASVIFDQALLAEGGQLEDPATFVRRLNDLLLSMAAGPVG